MTIKLVLSPGDGQSLKWKGIKEKDYFNTFYSCKYPRTIKNKHFLIKYPTTTTAQYNAVVHIYIIENMHVYIFYPETATKSMNMYENAWMPLKNVSN